MRLRRYRLTLFRSINLMNSLAYYYNNYLSETENCYFMPVVRPVSAATLAGTEASRNATMDTTGTVSLY